MKIHHPQFSRIYFLISSERLTLLKAQLHCWGKQAAPAKELQMPICLCSMEINGFMFSGSSRSQSFLKDLSLFCYLYTLEAN